ncbi:hypothetical protein RF11_10925 [Thelohanellus kitauei]|uniref:Uncharacterized protein n=1 Tax=Thelohanellus kitauei TaxID=669202 RepID=A0A0C2JGW7_THEKT|nr:hypothetical protein RF11_10925 [Thelohanellus kitauei]
MNYIHITKEKNGWLPEIGIHFSIIILYSKTSIYLLNSGTLCNGNHTVNLGVQKTLNFKREATIGQEIDFTGLFPTTKINNKYIYKMIDDFTKRFEAILTSVPFVKPATAAAFTSIANATVSTYGKDIRGIGTLLHQVRVVRISHPLNVYPFHLPRRAMVPTRHSFTGKYKNIC